MTYPPGIPHDPPREIFEKEWREPPGWLGEAVRRAKLIPRGGKPPAPAP